MKALSLLQPWATLIMLGYKQFETRSWGTKHRGPLAIAASAGKPASARELCTTDPIISNMLAHHGLTFDTLPRGVILGVCAVDEMHKMDDTWDLVLDDLELACGDYTNGRVAWALSHVQPFAKPIPCKGALSLWEVPTEIEEQFPLSSVPVAAITQSSTICPLPTKEALAQALSTRYGGASVMADDVLSIMPGCLIEEGLDFQATRDCRTDWYNVVINSAGQIDHTTITELAF